MNTINEELYSYYGFKISKIEGILDMPSRLGDTTYDWGNEIEPLVDEKDIFWKNRDIKIDVFFDGKRYGMNFNEALSKLKLLPKEFVLSTNYGNLNVKLKQVIKVKGFTDKYAKLKLIFTEKQPKFIADDIDSPSGGNGILIDDFDLYKDFDILVSNVKFYDNIPVLKQSQVTVFQSSKPFNNFRQLNTIQLSCTKIYYNTEKLRETTEKLKKLLSQEGYRIVTYNGKKYSCFLTEGFVVKIYKNHIKFNLKLNINSGDEFSNFFGSRSRYFSDELVF